MGVLRSWILAHTDQLEIHFASPWRDRLLDLFHLLHNKSSILFKQYGGLQIIAARMAVPSNSGDGYAGFSAILMVTSSPGGAMYNEYLQIKLSEPLIAGNTYCFQYYLSPTIRVMPLRHML
jgi:hypothetical protein